MLSLLCFVFCVWCLVFGVLLIRICLRATGHPRTLLSPLTLAPCILALLLMTVPELPRNKTCRPVAVRYRNQLRHLPVAFFKYKWASVSKSAPGRIVLRGWHTSGYHGQSLPLAIGQRGNRFQKAEGIRMGRCRKDVFHPSLFNDSGSVHHQDPVTHFPYDTHVVGN
jgi:hypothetical protein